MLPFRLCYQLEQSILYPLELRRCALEPRNGSRTVGYDSGSIKHMHIFRQLPDATCRSKITSITSNAVTANARDADVVSMPPQKFQRNARALVRVGCAHVIAIYG